jgi:hypothetical protein
VCDSGPRYRGGGPASGECVDKVSWRSWTYGEWNTRLIAHHFLEKGTLLNEVVERIPASPEELVAIARDPGANAGEVAKAFSDQIVLQLPRNGRSFCGFCHDYGSWTRDVEGAPHFFGMLWFTCLVAYGYRSDEGDFYRRAWGILGKKDNFRRHGLKSGCCLPELWEDFRRWTCTRHAAGAPIRELVLPPEVGVRTAIGLSWFLAFPHKLDRNLLARCLWDAGLVGFEPPIQPVLRSLESRREGFSEGFREDLDDFISRFIQGGNEPLGSAFWRAVRQEALDPSLGQNGRRAGRGPRTGLVIFGSDEGLRPLVCCAGPFGEPAAFARIPLEEIFSGFSHYLVGPGGSLEAPVEEAFSKGELLGLAHRKLVEQGLLILREHSTGTYALVSGSEAYGSSLALARSDVADAFIGVFGGRKIASLVPGWFEVLDCKVRPIDSLPEGLHGALQLLQTMQTPVLAPVGGIRVPGGFFFFANFLPSLRASGAARVGVLDREGNEVPCERLDDEGAWAIPPSVLVQRRGDVTARATWVVEQQGIRRERRAETAVRFVEFALDDDSKGLPAGFYFLEACTEPEVSLRGGGPVPFGIACGEGSQSADLLAIEGTGRYLGPGLGEMSVAPSSGFDWLAVGPKNRPDLLIFVGDVDHPVPPAARRSPDGGDRRHWKAAFANARRMVLRLPNGQYCPLAEKPYVAAMQLAYRSHNVTNEAPAIVTTDLETLDAPTSRPSVTAEITLNAADALVALSARRSGLSYEDVTNILSTAMQSRDYLAIQQVVRGWAECGLIDVVRDAHRGRLVVVARVPSLVMVRRGPEVEGTVVGLLGSVRESRLKRALSEVGTDVRFETIPAPNPWQPAIRRIRGLQEQVEGIGRAVGIEAAVWLDWPDVGELPAHFNVDNAYKSLPAGPAPLGYRTNARWEWDQMVFRRGDQGAHRPKSVEIERRIHADGSSIYVVLGEGGEVFCWTHLRNWALLVGYDLVGEPPFVQSSDDRVSCSGRSPVHLPLPIARLCALVGTGLPGPVFQGTEVKAYTYPFGRRLFRLIAEAIPRNWLRPRR